MWFELSGVLTLMPHLELGCAINGKYGLRSLLSADIGKYCEGIEFVKNGNFAEKSPVVFKFCFCFTSICNSG